MTATKRSSIVSQIAEVMKNISVANGYNTNLDGLAFPRMKFWDEVNEFPAIFFSAGSERIVYQGGGYKDRYLTVILRCYVNSEDSVNELELLLEDIEKVIDNNGRLAYQDSAGNNFTTRDIIILNIDTDQGALAPLGVGEMILEVKY